MNILLFNWVDYCILGIIALSVLIGLFRGLVKEALSLIAWIMAVWLSFHFSASLSALMTGLISNNALRHVAAFAILFIGTMLAGIVINYLLAQIIQTTGLSGADRTLGVVFGFGRGVLLVTLLLLLGSLGHAAQQPWWKASQLIPVLKPFILWLKVFLPDKLTFDMG